MIKDKEMKEILDEMNDEKEEENNDINSVNNADFVKLKVRSHVTTIQKLLPLQPIQAAKRGWKG